MLSKFSDNLRMLHGKRKRQIAGCVYIIEGKCKPALFQKSLKVLKKVVDI